MNELLSPALSSYEFKTKVQNQINTHENQLMYTRKDVDRSSEYLKDKNFYQTRFQSYDSNSDGHFENFYGKYRPSTLQLGQTSDDRVDLEPLRNILQQFE